MKLRNLLVASLALVSSLAGAQGKVLSTPVNLKGWGPFTFGMSLEQALKADPKAAKLPKAVAEKSGLQTLAERTEVQLGDPKNPMVAHLQFDKHPALHAIAFTRADARRGATLADCDALTADFTRLWGKPTREGKSKDSAKYGVEWDLGPSRAQLQCNVDPSSQVRTAEAEITDRPAR